MAPRAVIVTVFIVTVINNLASAQHTLDCECGLENIQTRIINGVAAQKGRYPWIASVLIPAQPDGSYALCTGSLINDRYILTAASCLKDPTIDASKILVSIKTHTQYEYTTNTLKVASFIAHPDFEEYKTNNVALIKLQEPVNITARDGSGVSPICLPSFDPSESASDVNPLFVAGFGFTEGNNAAEQLNEVGVEEIESMKCLEQFKSASGQFLNIKMLLCGQSEHKGINQGDFGGPLAVRDAGQVYQAGIASYYFTNGQTGGKLFDVYERITPHVRWISSHTEDANWCRAPAQAIQPAPVKSSSQPAPEKEEAPKDTNQGSKNPVIQPPKEESSESNKNQGEKETSSSEESEKKLDQGVVNPGGNKETEKTETSPPSSSESSNKNQGGTIDEKENAAEGGSIKKSDPVLDGKNDGDKTGDKTSTKKESSEKKKVPSARDRWEAETKPKEEKPKDGAKEAKEKKTSESNDEKSCECGTEKLATRIVNGRKVTSVKYPWLASIVVSEDGENWDTCGGALINDRFILTAAHCVDTTKHADLSKFIVTLGSITKDDRFDRPHIEVESIKRHPKFDEKTFKFDIALVKVKKPLTFNDTVLPICLPKVNGAEYDNLFAAGFGFVDDGVDGNGKPKLKPGNELRETDMTQVDIKTCSSRWSDSDDGTSTLVDKERNVCAGSEEDRFGKKYGQTCLGDSGGPLSTRKDGRVFAVGVTSFGHPDCGIRSKVPDIFESVPYHIKWINDETNPSNWCSGKGQAIEN